MKNLFIIWIGIMAFGCSSGSTPPDQSPAPLLFADPGIQELQAICHSAYGKADRKCTPGAINPDVMESNLDQTICLKGWTTSIRPSRSVTENVKRKQMKQYGLGDRKLSEFEEDHLIPLEVGGSPSDELNLWPEPRAGRDSSARKDQDENRIRKAVCSKRMALADGQKYFRDRWSR